MKKINILFLILLISILSACNTNKEYSGTKITKLTYITIDYNGGYTKEYLLDFNNNEYLSVGYLPIDDINPQLELKKTFTEKQEKEFIDTCYTHGLFNLKESYSASGIIDGGGWDLIIEYEDGTTKTSKGDNAAPDNVFQKCSTAFYDICGEVVMGRLPDYYDYPPNVSYAFHYSYDKTTVSTNGIAKIKRGNYKWNNFESLDNDYFQINEEIKDKNEFVSDYKYELVLYTSNYDCKEIFIKAKVTEYDYNSELTNKKELYTGIWFSQIEIELQLNKIYVYELKFLDGDYVQYTFNTFCNE